MGQGSFFCFGFFFGPAQNKKAHQELSRERRGLPGKIEFFSWVLPGGPHFFSCCGVFFFFFSKIAPRAFFYFFFNAPGLAEKTPIPANFLVWNWEGSATT